MKRRKSHGGWVGKKKKEMKTVAESGSAGRGSGNSTTGRSRCQCGEKSSACLPKMQSKEGFGEGGLKTCRTYYTSSSLPFLINASLFVHNEYTCYRKSSLLETIVRCDLRSGRSMMWMQAGVHHHRLPVYFIKSK